MKAILKGHISPETAYVVDDYPYGFRLRCKIRYWLEYHPKRGFRLVSQTTNPKRGNVWNKPKASTYARFGGCMFLDDDGHVQWQGLSEYSSGAEAKAFSDKYREGVPEAGRDILDRWVAAKLAYDGARQPDDPLDVGLPEARKAFANPNGERERDQMGAPLDGGPNDDQEDGRGVDLEQMVETADPDSPELTGNERKGGPYECATCGADDHPTSECPHDKSYSDASHGE
jgi:hypothetical protein